jgi:hypothetical protein
MNECMIRAVPFGLLIFITGVITWMSSAEANCVVPIRPPESFIRSDWKELEGLSAKADGITEVTEVQSLRETGHGALNLDFYAIQFDAGGYTPESLMKEIRGQLSSVIFSGTSYNVAPYDDANRKVWEADKPARALMTFTLAEVPNVIPLERGSVMVSCFSSTGFTFSTVTTKKDGLHPVSGNRGFGVVKLADGSLMFFTKAADRVVNRGMFSALPEPAREAVFSQGHKVWVRLLDNLSQKYIVLKPRNRVEHSVRIPY